MSTNILRAVARYFLELGHLKNVRRSGWELLGIRDGENVAEHTARGAQIALILALLEGVEYPEKSAVMFLFHDTGEIRTNDPHKIAQRYVRTDETRAIADATHGMGLIADYVRDAFATYETGANIYAIIAKDADRLEVMLTSMEYVEQGYTKAQEWFDRSLPLLKTESAKHVAQALTTMSPSDWWQGLKVQ